MEMWQKIWKFCGNWTQPDAIWDKSSEERTYGASVSVCTVMLAIIDAVVDGQASWQLHDIKFYTESLILKIRWEKEEVL